VGEGETDFSSTSVLGSNQLQSATLHLSLAARRILEKEEKTLDVLVQPEEWSTARLFPKEEEPLLVSLVFFLHPRSLLNKSV